MPARTLNIAWLLAFPISLLAGETLPQGVTFRNKPAFDALVARAQSEDWRDLPMGERVARFGYAMCGTRYEGFTLEIDDHVESPSANFSGQDCWTFFEIALGLARMIEVPREAYTPHDLLSEIEWTRYRGGVCTGRYLERIHYLAEWWYDNEARGNVTNQTGGHCSHVGLAYRTDDGVCHFLHASKNHRKVTLDKRLSSYLAGFKYHAGIIIARPLPRSGRVTDTTS